MTPDIGDNCLVTIIIPFHNRIELTIGALRSACNQNYENIEIILVDDGSTVDLQTLENVVKEDERVLLFRLKKSGVSVARNYGIDRARGEYIAFLDSDDYFEKNKISFQLTQMKKHESKFSHTSYITISKHDLGINRDLVNTSEFSGYVYPDIISQCLIATPTVMIHRSLLKTSRFNETIDFGEDVCFWIDLAKDYSILGINKPLTFVRVDIESASKNIRKQKVGLLNIIDHVSNGNHQNCIIEIGNLYFSIARLMWHKGGLKPFLKHHDIIKFSNNRGDNLLHRFRRLFFLMKIVIRNALYD